MEPQLILMKLQLLRDNAKYTSEHVRTVMIKIRRSLPSDSRAGHTAARLQPSSATPSLRRRMEVVRLR